MWRRIGKGESRFFSRIQIAIKIEEESSCLLPSVTVTARLAKIYKLAELGEVSFGISKLGELGEVSFGMFGS